VTPAGLLADGFGRIPALIERAVEGLDARALAARPVPGANSIAWLAWHTARGQDAWVGDLDGTEPVWTAAGWFELFALPFPPDENGFGMADGDTTRVVASAELLTAYLRAVAERTLGYLATLSAADLDDIIDASRTPAVSRGTRLLSILDDGLQHCGQAAYARGILGGDGIRSLGVV
jgi:uncharacterized damage-inducible protein DinB